MTELMCLNPEYSTTRRVVYESLGINHLELPANKKKIEGGLRVQGYIKNSQEHGNYAIQSDRVCAHQPLITVIIVVFNGAKSLEQAILSVIYQSYNNVEFIVVDGGSTDATIDIIRKYEHAIDYWISESDEGIYDAMNKGIKLAKGDWIYFLGCDDVLVNTLHKIAPLLIRSNIIYYGDVYMSYRHKLYGGPFSTFKLAFENICHQGTFYPNSVFKKYSYDIKYKVSADYHLNIRCYSDRDFSFCYIKQLIAIYNDYSGVSAISADYQLESDRMSLVKQNFNVWIFLYFFTRQKLVRIFDLFGIKATIKTILKKKL